MQEYLADTSKAQVVYQALLNRASAEPIRSVASLVDPFIHVAECDDGETYTEVICCSLAVVAKCVDVLKRYLSRQVHFSLVLFSFILLLGTLVVAHQMISSQKKPEVQVCCFKGSSAAD